MWTLLAIVSVFGFERYIYIKTLQFNDFSLSLKWLILCCLALSLNGSNLAGYSRARLGTREGVSRQVSQWFLGTVLRRRQSDRERMDIIKK